MENEAINRADLIVTALFWISSLPNVLIVAPVADTDASTRKMMTCLIPVRKDRWRFPLFIAGIDACFSKLAAVHSFADQWPRGWAEASSSPCPLSLFPVSARSARRI